VLPNIEHGTKSNPWWTFFTTEER